MNPFLLAEAAADAAAIVPVAWPREELAQWASLAGLFGLLVGAAELLGRYRDEPLAALLRVYGIMYVGFNALVSVGLFLLLYARHAAIIPTLSCLEGSLLSGFGAMALLRSKFFTFRTKSDEEIPIGLDIVVRKLLDVADRGVDRGQSRDRWKTTYDHLKGISDKATFDDLIAFLKTTLKSYQNVSADELEMFDTAMTGLASDTTTNVTLRAMAAGLAFQEIAGTLNFDKTVKQFFEWKQASVQAAH
jgi:hypothetical protein